MSDSTSAKSNKKFGNSEYYNRGFSEEFRRQKISDLLAKRITISQLCELYNVSRTSVYKWLYLYSPEHERGTKTVVQMESEATKVIELQTRLAALERAYGLKQLEVDYANQLLAAASAEVGYDVKKKVEAKLSSTSAPTLPPNTHGQNI